MRRDEHLYYILTYMCIYYGCAEACKGVPQIQIHTYEKNKKQTKNKINETYIYMRKI